MICSTVKLRCKAKKMVKDTSKMIYTKIEKMEKED
jgi:hypothetical protein